jgi:hypothetical protein
VRTARGGNAFLFPNLIPNGSFEFPACLDTDVVRDWYTAGDVTPALSIAPEVFIPGGPAPVPYGTVADEGITALKFQTVAGQVLAVGANTLSALDTRAVVNVTPGEVYLFHCRWQYTGAEDPHVSFIPSAYMVCDYDAGTQTVFTMPGTFTGSTQWNDFYSVLTIPSGLNTNVRDFRMRISVALSNAGTAPITLNGSNVFLINEVGCALLKPVTPYGRMAGSHSLGCPVRFSKLPELSDIGFGQGVKRYGANFELTEV